MIKYQLNRYHKIRKEILNHLGGKCVKCGAEENIELDHKDKNTKVINVAKIFNLSRENIWKEAIKCQLLCKSCHKMKSILEAGKKVAKGTHGTLSAYRYCHCEICIKGKREWNHKYDIKYNKRRRELRKLAKIKKDRLTAGHDSYKVRA